MAELDAGNNLTASYTHSPLRPDDVLGAKFTSAAVNAGLVQSAGNVYYLKDHLNTVNEITNATGDVIQKMEYSAFGVLRSVKDSTGTEVGFDNAPVRSSFAFTGREFEPELNMYYYRARYYDASTGRFMQTDPDPGKLASPNTFLSKYIYAENNPKMFMDPSGRANILGWILAFAFPIQSLIAMNTTDLFQTNFGFSEGDIKGFNTLVIVAAIIAIAVSSGYGGREIASEAGGDAVGTSKLSQMPLLRLRLRGC